MCHPRQAVFFMIGMVGQRYSPIDYPDHGRHHSGAAETPDTAAPPQDVGQRITAPPFPTRPAADRW
jgi:hypothetical protein